MAATAKTTEETGFFDSAKRLYDSLQKGKEAWKQIYGADSDPSIADLTKLQPLVELNKTLGLSANPDGKIEIPEKLKPAFKALIENPEGTKNLTEQAKANPELAATLKERINSSSGTELTSEQADSVNNLVTQAVKDPTKFNAVADQAKDLKTRSDALVKTYPNLGETAAASATKFDLSNLDAVSADLNKKSELLKTFEQNPKFAELAEKLAAKSEGNSQATTDLAAKFQDPQQLNTFATKINGLLEAHPGVGDFVVSSFNPAQASNPETGAALTQILQNPEAIDVLKKGLDENQDLEGILTGKLKIDQVDPMTFIQRNPTLVKMLNNPTVSTLFSSSQFAKDNPEIQKLLQDKFVQTLYSTIGGAMGASAGSAFGGASAGGAPSRDDEEAPAQEPNFFVSLIMAVLSFFTGGKGQENGVSPLTGLMDMFKGGQERS